MVARTRPPCPRCEGTGSLPVGPDSDYVMVVGLMSAPLCPDCEGEGETPPTLRRFELHRIEDVSGVSGTGVVAQGVEFDDGVVALRWLTEWPTSVVFHDRGAEAVEHVHGHNGRTEVVWLDESSAPGETPPSLGADPNSVVVSPPVPLATTEPPSAAGGVPPAPPAAGSGLHPRADLRPSGEQDR